jgi:hypothetical protein
MSVEVRELTEGGFVWEGTSRAAEWGCVEAELRKKGAELQRARYHA